MALIVIRTSIIAPDVEIIDGRAEEELANIVQRLGKGVGDAIAPPSHGPLQEGYVQSVIMRIGKRRVLTVVRVIRIRTAPIVRSGRDTGRDVLVHGHDQMQSTQVLIAEANGGVFPDLLLDFQ